jgi:phenol/toluene 2-monooxygenase (NADH) P2/A2
MSNVFIVLQSNEDTRPIVEAIEADNPRARVSRQPAMVRIEAPEELVIRRATIEEQVGGAFDLQSLHVNLVTLGGHVSEDEEQLTLSWNH